MIGKTYVKLFRFFIIPGLVAGGVVSLFLKEPWRGYVIGITIAAAMLVILLDIAILYIVLTVKRVRAAWEAQAKDNAVPLSEIARLKLAALGRAAVSGIADLMKREKVRAWQRELGDWPLIWHRPDTGEYIIKVRYLDADVVYNRLVRKLAGGTGFAWFLLVMLGENGTPGSRFGGAVFIGLVCAALSFPVWWGYFQVRLTFTLYEGRISWTVWGTEWGKDKGGSFPDGAKLEVPQAHELADEELRVFNENLRRGAIKETAKFRPIYQNASQLILRSGFKDRDDEIIANMADDPKGRKAYKLKTAIEFVHEKSIAETIMRNAEAAGQEGRAGRFE